jgi:formylglycine-generating enzyme required for sulfatase activity
LRAFETGGFTYVDVRSQLTLILAKGASASELLETLRRRERVEPLPPQAHEEVLRLLNDAVEQQGAAPAAGEDAADVPEAAQQAAASPDAEGAAESAAHAETLRALKEQLAQQSTEFDSLARAYERTKDVQTAASERVTALAAELAAATRALEAEQNKTREYGKALAERTASAEAHQARGEELLRKAKEYDLELREARETLAGREADLAALRQEHAALAREMLERHKGAPQLLAELESARSSANALAADLADTRALLETEQLKARELQQSHAQAVAAAEAARAQTRESLTMSERQEEETRALRAALAERDGKSSSLAQEHAQAVAAAEAARAQSRESLVLFERHEAETRTLRTTLAERESKIIMLEREQASVRLVQESHAKTLTQTQAELSAARVRADGLLTDLNDSRGTAASLDAQLKRAKFDLDASRNELASVKAQAHSYLDLLRTREWRRASEDSEAGPSAQDAGANLLQLQAQLEAMQAQLEGRDTEIEQLRTARNLAPEASREIEPTDTDMDIDLRAETFEQPLPTLQAQPKFLIVPEEWKAAAMTASAATAAGSSAPGIAAVPSRKPFAPPRVYALAAIALVLGLIIWVFVHNRAPSTPVPAPVQASVGPGSVIQDCPACPTMVVLPTGRFKQGANEGENLSAFDKPRHWVAISHPVAVSMNPVTRDEYAAFVAATGRDVPGCDIYDGAWKHDPNGSWKNPGFAQTGAHPVTCVSWNDAQAYASWLSSKAGHKYRLPSASEWEYAARAGSETALPWGAAADTCANANVADQSAAQQFPGWTVFGCSDGWVYTAPTGSFKANKFALNDMLGNVFQWTQDCWKADYVGAPIDGSAREDGNCAQRELRGGSWFSNPSYIRTNYRNHFATDYRTSSVGIRLVREM